MTLKWWLLNDNMIIKIYFKSNNMFKKIFLKILFIKVYIYICFVYVYVYKFFLKKFFKKGL